MKKELWQRLIVFVLPAFLLVILFDVFVFYMITEHRRQDSIIDLQNQLSSIRFQLKSEIQKDLQVVKSIALLVKIHQKISAKMFHRLARELIKTHVNVMNITLSKKLTIYYVYPEKYDSSLIGKNFFDMKEKWPAIKKVIESKKICISDPFPLVQGGIGMIGRYPIFFEDKFYGIVSATIDFNALTKKFHLFSKKNHIDIAIRKKDEDEKIGEILYGKDIFEKSDVVKMDFPFQDDLWEIAGRYKNSKISGFFSYGYLHVVFVLVLIIYFFLIKIKIVNDLKLELSEARFRDFSTSSADWVWETDPKGVYVYASGNVEKILGYRPKELIGKTPFDLMDEEEAFRVRKIFQKMASEKKAIKNLENWNYSRDSRLICLQTSGVPLINQRGKLIGYRGVDRDITEEKKAAEALLDKKRLLNLFFQQSMDGFFFMMLDEPIEWNEATDKEKTLTYIFDNQKITKINDAMLTQYAAQKEDFIALTPSDLYKDDIEYGKKEWAKMLNNGSLHIDKIEKRMDGKDIMIEGNYICIYEEDSRFKGHFGIQREITKEREDEYELKRYIDIVDENVITSKTDLDGNITYVSKAFSEISGYSPDELIGKNHNIVRHPDMPKNFYEALWGTIKQNKTWHGEIKNKTKIGGEYWVDTYISPIYNVFGIKAGYMAVRQDITNEKKIEILSITDSLTGIYNRMKLDQFLSQEFYRYERYDEPLSVIMLDIDYFKKVNDSYGHMTGDYVLKKIAQIASDNIRKTDIVGRWGGEEFLIICPHNDLDGAFTLAEKIRRIIEKTKFEEVEKVTASFGVACSSDAKNSNDLLKDADEALYHAKNSGRNCVKDKT